MNQIITLKYMQKIIYLKNNSYKIKMESLEIGWHLTLLCRKWSLKKTKNLNWLNRKISFSRQMH